MTHVCDRTFRSPVATPMARFLMLQRAIGYRYRTGERMLHHLDLRLRELLPADDPVITQEIAEAVVAKRPHEQETTRAHRTSMLRQLCRFLACTEPRTFVPPAGFGGGSQQYFQPRILSQEEAKRFLEACLALRPHPCSPLRPVVHATRLMLLYTTGLRLGEARRLTLEEADLTAGVLQIRNTKFGKDRTVPMAADMTERMRWCRKEVTRACGPRPVHSPFFPSTTDPAAPCDESVLRVTYRRLLHSAGIPHRRGEGPRLHDLRHTFAVHRLLRWYEEGEDLRVRLPLLATYLGHVSILTSQRYLHFTEDFLPSIAGRMSGHDRLLFAPEEA
jgi:integrase/recombinase XerD